VNYLVIPQLYTIIAFGTSVYFWGSLSKIPLPTGVPLYSIHPLFMLELLLSLSTAIVWFVAFLGSLHGHYKEVLSLTGVVRKNLLIVSLAIFTVVVALSGCVVYSQSVPPSEEYDRNVLWTLRGLSPPNPFALLHGCGILLCEASWIITALLKYLRAH